MKSEQAVKIEGNILEISQSLTDALTAFALGARSSQAKFGSDQQELITIGMLTALGGAEPQLRTHLNAALNAGVDPDELIALAEHTTLYAGSPRVVNLLKETKRIVENRGFSLPFSAARHAMGDHEMLVTDTGGDRPVIVLVHALGLDRRM